MVRFDGGADLSPLLEAMDHGRDGHPHWVAVETTQRRITETAERIAAAATERGFVAVPVETYVRACAIGTDDFDERTLLLFDAGRCAPARAHAALLRASAQSARPHLLMTLAGRPHVIRGGLVREARAAYVSRVVPRESSQVRELLVRAARAEPFAACGRHAAAERLLRDVSAALLRRDAHQHASRLMLSLGRMLHERGRVKAAFDIFEEAISSASAVRAADLIVEGRLMQAMTRIDEADFLQAETLCRAVLESSEVPPALKAWAHAVLMDALLWQGRAQDATDFDAAPVSALESAAVAYAADVRVRFLLDTGRVFEAGRAVEDLAKHAAGAPHPVSRVIAGMADLRLLTATGDLNRANGALAASVIAARAAKVPLRGAWARVLWVDALQRAGRRPDAKPHLDRLAKLGRLAPPLLRREIEQRLLPDPIPTRVVTVPHPPSSASLPIHLLRVAFEEDDDLGAIRRLSDRLREELSASRIDVLSAAAGPVTTMWSSGDGLPTRIGARVLEVAFPIGPEKQAAGSEAGRPIRFGGRVVGAIVCRWPMTTAVPADAGDLLEMISVAIAPRLDALLAVRRDAATAATAVPELLGVSDAMANVRKAIVRAAAAPFALLVEGESGVGKELVARAVHQLSPRRDRRFCDVNCAALPDDLLESELFGHARGAFSGAVVDRVGLFEEADGGTLLLDEVADLSARAQAKLLRAIQQQEIRRVGESFSRKVDVRIVSAANRDMRAESSAGRFRQDLLYRLDVLRICIPPLRDRPGDIPVLAEHCWQSATARTGSRARLSPATLVELSRFSWPGNVRELQNVVAALAVAAPLRGRVGPGLLPSVVSGSTTASPGRLADAREQFERRFVELALARAGGNRARAARSLGMSRQGLAKILGRLGVDGHNGAAESC